MKVYVFDVDGTLTPSRLTIDPNFKKFFLEWMKNKKVIFVTGSDKDKTIEQIGLDVWNEADACMQSCGNHIFVKGEEVSRNPWEVD
jgi:phosphomannomutase